MVEIQTKTGKFFDSWKTVATLKSSTRPSTEADREAMDLTHIQFDKKCGKIPGYDERTLRLLAERADAFDVRKLPEKQWVAPATSCVVEGCSASQPLTLHARCGNKYGMGNWSNAMNVELKSAKKKKEKKAKPAEKKEEKPVEKKEEKPEKKEEKKEKPVEMEKKEEKEKIEFTELAADSSSSDSSDSDSDSDSDKKKKKAKGKPAKAKVSKPTDEAVMAEILQGGIPSLLKQVEAGVSVGALRSKNGSSLLHEAVSANQEELAKYLVENKIVEANAVNDVVYERE